MWEEVIRADRGRLDHRGRLAVAVLLAVTTANFDSCSACRFADLARGTSHKGSAYGRELLGFSIPYLNNTGKAPALAISQSRGKGTLEALVEYSVETLPLNIQDLLTPMGNYTDAEVMWSDAVLAAKYIPAGVHYAVKSLPDLLEEASQLVKTDWSNVSGMEKLDSRYRTIFNTIATLINQLFAGLQLRMAFHDAGTYNPNATYKGGANGSLRFEFDWPSNAGIQRFLYPLIWAVKQALDDALETPTSYADLMAISGAAGIYNANGPLINVGYGRPDVDGPDPFQGVGSNTNQQRDYPIQAIIDEWASYGFTIEELVTLSGAHSIGLSASTNPQGQISAAARVFDNHYYKQIIRGDAFFGSDNALADNPDTYELVKAYAADNELWYQKFSAAFFKLTWLGVNTSVPQLGL